MRKTIESLKNHFIICGFGQVGGLLASELTRWGEDFVVVERDPRRFAAARENGYLCLHGDATDEAVLTQARVEQARGLATVISDDAENLYITVSSRSLNPQIPIITRASRARGGRYLTQAGATSVIFLDQIGASRIARSLMRPDVVMFLEEMMGTHRDDMQLETLKIPAGCRLSDQTIMQLELRPRYGLQVLAIKRSGRYIPNPGPEQKVVEEDVLVAVGTQEGLSQFADVLEREIH
jgi:voltage-gated potassium channel